MNGIIAALIIGGFFQGIFLIIGLLNIKKANAESKRILIVFLALISVTLLGRAQYDNVWVQEAFREWGWIIDSFILVYSPLLFLYLRSVFPETPDSKGKHFLSWLAYPVVILIYNQWLVDSRWKLLAGLLIAAWVTLHLLYYHVKSFSILNQASRNGSSVDQEKAKFYQVVLSVVAVSFVVLVTNGVLMILNIDSPLVVFDYNLIWILISMVSFAFGYMAIVKPGFYATKIKNRQIDESLKSQLVNLMQDSEPYIDPEFNLHQLSELMGVKKQMISDLIHVGFDSNFYDFINEHRVKKFVQISQDENYSHLKYLALAYQAGFNSKTTFYKAFKKCTGQTPSQYFKQAEIKSEKMFG